MLRRVIILSRAIAEACEASQPVAGIATRAATVDVARERVRETTVAATTEGTAADRAVDTIRERALLAGADLVAVVNAALLVEGAVERKGAVVRKGAVDAPLLLLHRVDIRAGMRISITR